MNLTTELKGKVTFLNFWGTWCPPCRAEIPHFVDLLSTYSASGFQVVGIALERDPNKEMELVSNFVEKQKMNYRNFPSRKYADEFAKVFGTIQYVPTTYVIGKDGKIMEKIVGGRTKEGFEEIIKKYLNQ
jgi:thiol-disulfide isomerase/thioredoxin